MLARVLGLLSLTACLRAPTHYCDEGSDCVRGGVVGRCEPDDRCSYPSGTCGSGWAYGDSAGDLAGTCVDGIGPDIDAGPDAQVDTLQLMAVMMLGYEASPADAAWRILTREPGAATWTPVAETTPPNDNCDIAELADCCGPEGPDGIPEILVRCWQQPYVVRFARDPQGGLIGLAPLILEGGPTADAGSVAWVDADGDGDLDIVRGFPDLAFDLYTGGGFALQPPIAVGHHGIAIGNWDDDPEPEMAVASAAGVVIRERGDGSWNEVHVVDATFDDSRSVIWCDHRGDGHPDLIVGAVGDVRIYPNRGSAVSDNWLEPTPVVLGEVTGDAYLRMECGDINGDGADDLAYTGYGGVFVLPHGTASRIEIGVDLTPTGIDLADYDGDGRPDLLLTYNEQRLIEQWRNTSTVGSFSFAAPATVLTTEDPPVNVTVKTLTLPVVPRARSSATAR